MGNWKRVLITGSIPAEEHGVIGRWVNDNRYGDGEFHPLCNTEGVCGLGDWPAESGNLSEVRAVGNLAERDYTAEEVANALEEIAGRVPKTELKIHVGADYEADECEATITLRGGKVTVGEPEITTIPEIDDDKLRRNLMLSLLSGI